MGRPDRRALPDAWRVLDISYDDFIRTTEPRHYAAVARLLQACYDAGDIELGTYRGWYSVSDEEYIARRRRRGVPVAAGARWWSWRRRTTSSA